MEQATNQFNAGLQMDTHPMVQGNDTLTDALNATLITMNGNEVILQNDMGNRRVDNAFLPAGYEPVGIKEYGGIIYIAAYNPITNKSQIGSFPSPERKISPDDIKSGLKGTFNFSSLEKYTTKDSLKYLNNDTILVPLTSNNVLHAGDKFVVYADGIDAIKENITNYNNTSEKKIISPKNKKYTLQLGILNSQNEFVDITKNLCRWKIENDKSYVVSYTNESDLYKFNDGYFIANSLPDIEEPDYTKSDLELIKKRQVITANTYSYKLIGPLYLKATLNHIQDFNYNIYGVKNGNNADLYIEGYITYNCPDWITPQTQTGDDIFQSYELGTLSNNGWFDLKGIRQATGGNSEIINKEEKISYDPNTNLYTVKVIKKYTNVRPVSGTTLINYIVAVKCNSVGNSDSIYLENLSAKGVIDISKLGSGEITLTGWRFYNTENNTNTTLTYSFDAYPIYGREIKGLQFYFENVSDSSNNFTITNSSLYNGRVTINIDWTSNHIIERQLYRVTITDGQPESQFSFVRWFLSTPLMNSCFSGDNFIQDYGNDSRVQDKLKVFLTSNLQATDDNKINYADDYIHDDNGGWIRKRGSDKVIHTEFKHTCNINIGINPITEIINEEYYPKYVKVTNQGSLRVTPNLGNFNTTDIRIFKNSEDSRIELDNFVVVSQNPTASSSRILGTIYFYDKFKSVGDDTKIITNPFGKVEDWIKYSIFSLSGTYPSSNLPLYGGIGLDCNSENGPDDGHFVNIYYGSNKSVVMIRPNGDAPTSGGERIASKIADDEVIFSYNSIQDAVKSVFNDPIKVHNTSLFLYVFQIESDAEKWTNKMSYSSSEGGTAFTTLKRHARVWWRTSYGDWAMFRQLLGRNDDFYQFIKENVFGSNRFSNLYYNFADSISCEKADLLIPNENCYSYNYPYTLKADLNIKGNFTTNPTISTGGENYKIICKNGEVSTGTEIKFTLGTPINVEDLNIEIVLKSLDKFEEQVQDRIGSTLNGIDIVNGYKQDSKNDPLDINSFYILENGQLKKEESLPITITSDYSANPGYRGILYNNQLKGNASPQYDCMGDDEDDWTVVNYSNLFIVN